MMSTLSTATVYSRITLNHTNLCFTTIKRTMLLPNVPTALASRLWPTDSDLRSLRFLISPVRRRVRVAFAPARFQAKVAETLALPSRINSLFESLENVPIVQSAVLARFLPAHA